MSPARPALPALVACAHGTRSETGRAAVRGLVGALAGAMSAEGVEVVEAYVDVHGPELPDVVRAFGGDVVVVPLLLSAGYHVKVDLAEATSPFPSARTAPAMGSDPRLTAVLTDRLREAGATPEDRLLLAAAGSSDADAVASVERQARDLRRSWPEVTVAYGASARPRLACEAARLRIADPDRRLVAASYLLAPGFFHSRVTRSGAALVTAPFLEPGRPVDDALVDLLGERYRQALATP